MSVSSLGMLTNWYCHHQEKRESVKGTYLCGNKITFQIMCIWTGKNSYSMNENKYGFLVVCRVYPHLQDRENAATPSIEDNSAIMEESAMSGYYGDRDEDSFQEYDGKIFSQFLWNLCDDVKVQKVFENCVFLLNYVVTYLFSTNFCRF